MDKAPTEPDTTANVTVMPLVNNEEVPLANEMSGSVGKKVDDADMDMVDALDDEAITEEDEFDGVFPNTRGLVSLKMLFLIK